MLASYGLYRSLPWPPMQTTAGRGPFCNVGVVTMTRIRRPGVELIAAPRGKNGGLDLRVVLQELALREIVRLLVEGGPRVHGSLLDQGLADRVAIFLAPRIIGDPGARPLAEGRAKSNIREAHQLRDIEVRRLGDDILVCGDIIRA